MNFFRIIVVVLLMSSGWVNAIDDSLISKADLSNAAFQAESAILIWSPNDQLKLIANKQYDELERKLILLADNFEMDNVHEWALISSSQQIARFNKPSFIKTLLPMLDSWVEDTGSFSSYTFRGFWYSGMANYYRGIGWIDSVSEENILQMRKNHKLALADFQSALKIRANFSPIYERMIQIGQASGDEDLKLSALRTGLDENPNSYWIRSKYLNSLTPRWGGSFDKMQQFINEAIKKADSNPRIWSLRGAVFAEKAFTEQLKKNYNEASKLYAKALGLGDKGRWIRQLAYSYFMLNEYDKSKNQILKWREYNKSSPWQTRRLEQLLADIERAEALYDLDGTRMSIDLSKF